MIKRSRFGIKTKLDGLLVALCTCQSARVSDSFRANQPNRSNSKKISSVLFADDEGSTVVYSDMFGEVHSAPVKQSDEEKPTVLLGHVSIISSLVIILYNL